MHAKLTSLSHKHTTQSKRALTQLATKCWSLTFWVAPFHPSFFPSSCRTPFLPHATRKNLVETTTAAARWQPLGGISSPAWRHGKGHRDVWGAWGRGVTAAVLLSLSLRPLLGAAAAAAAPVAWAATTATRITTTGEITRTLFLFCANQQTI